MGLDTVLSIANSCYELDSIYRVWEDLLYNQQPVKSFEERKKEYLAIVHCLLKSDIIKLYAAYDKVNKVERPFLGSADKAVAYLKEWLDTKAQEELDKDYMILFFVELEYCLMKWLKPYPITEADLHPDCRI